MKKIFTSLFLFLSFHAAFAEAGIWEYYIDPVVNSQTKYFGNYGGASFDGADLGDFGNDVTSVITIPNVGIKTWKNGGSDVTGGRMYYRTYKQGTTPGSFNYSINFSWLKNLANQGDQEWHNTSTTEYYIPAGAAQGNYVWEIYFEIDLADGSKRYLNNNGSNYKATFEVITPQPVKFLSFSAKPKQQNAVVTWQTAIEENTKLFKVMKSVDGANFSEIASTPAKGNSVITQSYSILDNNLTAAENFYKIIAVDFDGKTTETEVVKLTVLNVKKQGIFYAQGNPLFRLFGFEKGSLVQIIDLNGRILKSLTFKDAGIDISDFAAGTYIISIVERNNKQVSYKIIK